MERQTVPLGLLAGAEDLEVLGGLRASTVGALLGGLVGSAFSVRAALIGGALMCLVGVVPLALSPLARIHAVGDLVPIAVDACST